MNYHSWVLATVMLCWTSAVAQTPSQEDPYSEQAVRAVLEMHGAIVSSNEKVLNTLGDRAAIGVMRVSADRSLENAEDMNTVLSIIRTGFGAPQLIAIEADRKPKATLFLLRHLQSLALPQNLKTRIDETRSFVLQATSH